MTVQSPHLASVSDGLPLVLGPPQLEKPRPRAQGAMRPPPREHVCVLCGATDGRIELVTQRRATPRTLFAASVRPGRCCPHDPLSLSCTTRARTARNGDSPPTHRGGRDRRPDGQVLRAFSQVFLRKTCMVSAPIAIRIGQNDLRTEGTHRRALRPGASHSVRTFLWSTAAPWRMPCRRGAGGTVTRERPFLARAFLTASIRILLAGLGTVQSPPGDRAFCRTRSTRYVVSRRWNRRTAYRLVHAFFGDLIPFAHHRQLRDYPRCTRVAGTARCCPGPSCSGTRECPKVSSPARTASASILEGLSRTSPSYLSTFRKAMARGEGRYDAAHARQDRAFLDQRGIGPPGADLSVARSLLHHAAASRCSSRRT